MAVARTIMGQLNSYQPPELILNSTAPPVTMTEGRPITAPKQAEEDTNLSVSPERLAKTEKLLKRVDEMRARLKKKEKVEAHAL